MSGRGSRLSLLLVLACALAASGASGQSGDGNSCTVSPDLAASRPTSVGEPTRVEVGIYLVDLSSINDATQSLTGDVFVSMTWKDERLLSEGLAGCHPDLDAVWNPRPTIFNERDLTEKLPRTVAIAADGSVRYQQRFVGDFATFFDLRDYPMDTQVGRVVLVLLSPDSSAFELVLDQERTGRSAQLSVSDWSVGEGTFSTDPLRIGQQGMSVPRLTFEVGLQRQTGYYVIKVLMPLVLIVCMSWAVFWIDPKVLPAQISVSASAILTLIAFQFSLGYLLPRLSYLTRADQLLLGSTVLVFAAFGEAVLTGFLAARDRVDQARAIDRHARWAFPLTFAGVLALTLF